MFSDSHMNMLFQRFVLAYYKKHHPMCKPSARQIKWDIAEDDSMAIDMLPTLQTDDSFSVL